ncbi:MAG TPA: hypothetical protein VF595_03275 [Tepidisphaeraceae bacterium]|jgi:hypothetical protein
MPNVTLAVGTQKGLFVFKSEDRKPFTLAAHHLAGWEVSALLMRSGAEDLDFLVGTTHYAYGPVTRRSRDGGRTWTQPEGRPAYADGSAYKTNRIWQLSAAPGSGTLYAGIDEAALFRSADDGDTWQEVAALTAHPTRPQWQAGGGGLCLHTIVHDYSDPRRLWVAISAVGVLRTTDGGTTWSLANAGLSAVPTGTAEPQTAFCVHKMVQHPTWPDTLYMQFHGGVFVSTDGAITWQACENGLPGNFGFPMVILPDGTLVIAPLDSEEKRYFADGQAAVYRSTDGAQSWQPARSVIDGRSYASVLRDAMATDGGRGVYLGTTSGEVAVSADAGQTWAALDVTLPRVLCVRAIGGVL